MLLGKVCVAYLARWPEASLEVVASERNVALVEDGFDVAIRVGPLHQPDLVARKLAPAARAICGSPAYLARRGVPQRPADLADHECINKRPTWQLVGPGGPVDVAVNGRLAITDLIATRDAVLGGAGLAQLPMVLVQGDLAAGRLVAVLEPWTRRASTHVYAVFPAANRNSPNVRAFLDVLVEHLPEGGT
jgi:DNA-binding transcriptional LysR family regulator